MKTLIIIDFQNDFCDKDQGSYYIEGTESAANNIINYINNNASDIKEVIFVKNQHSENYCGFEANGGDMPINCVFETYGAEVNNDIVLTCLNNKINIREFIHGDTDDEEEFGAFYNITSLSIPDNNDNFVYHLYCSNISGSSAHIFQTTDLVICGLIGEYAIKETVNNLIHYKGKPKINIELMMNGIVSLDGGTNLRKFAVNNRLQIF